MAPVLYHTAHTIKRVFISIDPHFFIWLSCDYWLGLLFSNIYLFLTEVLLCIRSQQACWVKMIDDRWCASAASVAGCLLPWKLSAPASHLAVAERLEKSAVHVAPWQKMFWPEPGSAGSAAALSALPPQSPPDLSFVQWWMPLCWFLAAFVWSHTPCAEASWSLRGRHWT